jgi:hypothetical protein
VTYCWRIVLATVFGLLPIGPVQAGSGSSGGPANGPAAEPPIARRPADWVAEATAPRADSAPATSEPAAPTKSSDDNYKWLIKSPPQRDQQGDDQGYKWAIPAADKSAASEKPGGSSDAKPDTGKKSTSYYRPASSYATNPDSDPPRYVRRLSETGIEAFKDINWLDIGFEFRTRYEMRRDDFRRVEAGFDNPFFLRSRAYLGIREILDPFRFGVEFQDSRVYNNRFQTTDQENNPYDLIQGYGELYFKNALGEDDRKQNRPIRFRAGRMAYETLDRRFIARNEWRNTTNSFEGFRLNLGREANDWEIDLWGLQPVRRLQTKFDEANDHLWFYGAIGHWRKWSDIITLQPYYMGQKQTADPSGHTATNRLDREIHMPSLRGYGLIGTTGLDFDVNFSYQFGTNGSERLAAYGYTTEVGYKFKQHPWKPRLAGFYGYATGDRNPNDGENNRFDRFFGFARPWSSDHYIIYENIKHPRVRFDLQPSQKLGIEASYAWFWLASSTDRLFDTFDGNISVVRDPGFNRDRTGRSGDYVGSGVELRVRYQIDPRINTVVGYSHFIAGEFIKNRMAAHPEEITQRPGSSDFFYVEVVITAFK